MTSPLYSFCFVSVYQIFYFLSFFLLPLCWYTLCLPLLHLLVFFFHRTAFVKMRTASCWVITQWVVVISYWRCRINYRPHPQGSRIQASNDCPFCPILPPASTLLADAMLLRTCHCRHSSLYTPCTRVTGFLFGFLTFENGSNRFFQNVGKKLQLLSVITWKSTVLIIAYIPKKH